MIAPRKLVESLHGMYGTATTQRFIDELVKAIEARDRETLVSLADYFERGAADKRHDAEQAGTDNARAYFRGRCESFSEAASVLRMASVLP